MTSANKVFAEIHYEMVGKIAEGGMGLVYEAEQLGAGNFRKIVAVIIIREECSAIDEVQNNFIGEARLVADLIHTNIVQTYHLGQANGQYFTVMEFVRGVNLEQFLERHQAMRRTMPVDLAAFLISRIARGLTYAHEKCGRDGRQLNIVPKNIMIAYEGDVKLTVFGIAKALDLMHNEECKVIAGKDECLYPRTGQLRRHLRPARPLPARDRAHRIAARQKHLPLNRTRPVAPRHPHDAHPAVLDPAIRHRRTARSHHPKSPVARARKTLSGRGGNDDRSGTLPLKRRLRAHQRKAGCLHQRTFRSAQSRPLGRAVSHQQSPRLPSSST